MTLISTKWINYLHENETFLRELNPKLFDTLYEYELKKFTFELEEGYRGTDSELGVFPRFIFTYDACQTGNEIVVKIGALATAIVQVRKKTIEPPNRVKGFTKEFAPYFHLNPSDSDELQHFFDTFGHLLLRI